MILVTGASDNHYYTLINFIKSVIKNKVQCTLIIYNLGLNDSNWRNLQDEFKLHAFIYKTFDYSKYPEWFNINIDAGQYAWKPAIIYETMCEHPNEILVWMDSGNLVLNDLHSLTQCIIENKIYSVTSEGNISRWTFPETINYMHCTWTEKQNRNGACFGFNCNEVFVRDFIQEFFNLACIKECIAPLGSSRKNHRQDQAVFTILYYKYQQNHNFTIIDYQLGYTTHNDV